MHGKSDDRTPEDFGLADGHFHHDPEPFSIIISDGKSALVSLKKLIILCDGKVKMTRYCDEQCKSEI